MWFMNHVFNPFVRWLLISPFHSLMSKDVLLLEYRGRKSNKKFQTPLQFTRDGNVVWILVGFPAKKRWWHNLLGGAEVRVCLQRGWLVGHAIVLQGNADQKEIISGLKVMIKKFPSLASQYSNLDSPSLDLGEEVIVKVSLN